MKTDEAVRNAFREFSRRPDVNGLQRVLFVRYISGENGSQILLSQSPCIRKDSLNAWFASTGEGGSFDADAFREYCKRGLMRHAFRRKSVAASPALFQLAPSKQFAAEDKAFHLVLMHYLLSRGSDGCLLIVPGTDAASARLLSAGKTEQKVMTICEEVGSMTPAERQELLQTATARCLTVLTASEPGQADSVQLLPASADKSAKKAAAKKKKEDAAR